MKKQTPGDLPRDLPRDLPDDLPGDLLAAFDREADPLDKDPLNKDPLNDAALREWLLQHPEHLAAFATLRAQCHEMAKLPVDLAWPGTRPQRPWWPFALATGLLAAALVLWLLPPAAFRAAPEVALPRPRLAPAAAVQNVVVTIVTLGPGERHEQTHRHGTLARQTIESHTTTGAPQPNLTFRSTLSVAKNLTP